MTDDLVKRLRLIGTRTGVINRMKDAVAAREAADIIEKLEAALQDLDDGWECCAVSKAMRAIARKALDAK